MNEEWTPDGPTERGLADRLIDLYWRKQRLERYNHLVLEQRVNQIDHQNAINFQLGIFKSMGPKFAAAESVEAVEKILSGLDPAYQRAIREKVPHESCKDPSKWGQAINASLSQLKTETQIEGSAKFIAILDLDSLERELSRADRIDEAIDRTIKRLMQVKTAKQLFPSMRRNARPDQVMINLPAPSNSNGMEYKAEQTTQLPGKVENSAKREVSEWPTPVDYSGAILRIK